MVAAKSGLGKLLLADSGARNREIDFIRVLFDIDNVCMNGEEDRLRSSGDTSNLTDRPLGIVLVALSATLDRKLSLCVPASWSTH
jgi:hypothetical protein